ncbi:hypothetical protein DICPUDRAFT_80612 [Dictyostelium purpureum]|uniref:Uncharacterized protein n=1 Tax=Dictyostelium purpureum TaxID=5786 RepID=F0ZR04_DICPU|nr:uncharacterized protein DICPUDRAFT_80612 [Dictyostelium purpureum]EGC33634.1 hypothetical protein DICPUDRAFT_80612 [Dictyostelium purpureum]|eukprot:XP_003289854.1 hypothetical protein DICPUDRAFT_80612 [Dictyostelium purpureum]
MDEYKASIPGYVQCLLAGGNQETCVSEGPNFAAYFMFYFFIRLFGILLFCIYGTSENARNIWIHSTLLNHPAIKPFLLKYNIVNYNSVTVFGSGMAATNSKSMTSGKNKSR